MSMSTYIVGYEPVDEHWLKMKTIWEACENINVCIPEEVLHFFDYVNPCDKPGREITLTNIKKIPHDSQDIYEINIKDIPEGIEIIRFINSY